MSQLKWYLLKLNRCPRCQKNLTVFSGTKVECKNCRFSISYDRFTEIVESLVLKERKLPDQNLNGRGWERHSDYPDVDKEMDPLRDFNE